MRVLLDTNIVLDAMLQRDPWKNDADAILKAAALGQIGFYVTSLSLATVLYVGRKVVGTAKARADVRSYLVAVSILPIDKQTLLAADALVGSDFEDNITIAAAATASLDAIVTRNIADFAHSPVPAWEPAELVRRLAAGSARPSSGAGPSTSVP